MIPDNPRISVIIPTYNRAWTLKEAVDSVLAQDYKNYELIVVDDGSTDETRSVLDYCFNEITYIYQPNKGVSSARNTGIQIASGELIAFLDSDDLWLPQKLSVQADFFEKNPKALICQTEEIWIRNGIRVNPMNKHRKLSGDIFEHSLNLCLVSPSAVMIRKSLLYIAGMFDENLPACEDYDLWLRISCRYPVFLVDQPLIIKRGGHEDQLSKAFGLDKYRIYAILKLLKTDLLSEHQYASAVEVLRKKCRIYAQGCQKRGRNIEADEYMNIAVQI